MSKNLKDILLQHCQYRKESQGLLLLTLPTGFGKTHYVTDYLAEHIREGFSQRVWFVTNLKKNLPVESLRRKVGDQLFKQSVAFLNSYTGQACVFFTERDLPAPFSEWKSYQLLRNHIHAFQNFSGEDFKYRNYLREQAARAERQFRRELRQYLQGKFKKRTNPADRLSYIEKDPKLNWIPELYPSVTFFEKKVFFCSIDKFLRYVDTIIGPNIQLSNPEYLENTIVFIDEFDATKENVKKAIIENAIRFNQDIISLFIGIHYGLNARSFPEMQLAGISLEIIEKLRLQYGEALTLSNTLYQKYKLGHHYYYEQGEGEERAFLFHDFQYHTIISQGKAPKPLFLTREHSPAEKLNHIKAREKMPEAEDENLLFFLNDLRWGIYRFAYFIHDYALHYKKSHDKPYREEISLENAIRTALDLFDLKDRVQDYFIDFIFQQVNVHARSSELSFDKSPVSQGFRYYDVLNHKSHDATTRVLFADTLTTPETWLLHLCRHANVIGMSATAGFDSPLSNYSLSHLQHHLGERFFELCPEDTVILKEELERKNEHSNNREIRIFPVACAGKKQPALDGLLQDKGLETHFLHAFSNLDDYQVERYVKTALAYQHFLKHTDIYSFLCLLNKFPKTNLKDDFQERLLYDLFAALRQQHGQEDEVTAIYKVREEVRIINSQGFDEQLAAVHQELEAGKRIFLISTYSTMGAGQNIQYKAPATIPVAPINNLDYGNGEKDFDGIYLEKPTHLLFWLPQGEEMDAEQLLHYLFELEYLAEGGGISPKEKAARILKGFRRRLNPYDVLPSNQTLQERRCVTDHFCRVLIQAVGRLSRTRLRNPVTHILFDEKVKEMISRFQKGRHLLAPEFEELYRYCTGSEESTSADAKSISNRNRHNSLALAGYFRQLARRIPKWDQDTIRFWERLRRFVLCNPTLTEADARARGFQKYYIQHPEGKLANHYFFSSGIDDFRYKLDISFSKRIGQEVSANTARLQELMEVPLIRTLFEKEGYARQFAEADYILSPPLFRNIYLGALGETIGRHLLEVYTGQPLMELEPGEYELFDFKWPNGLYVDFKWWEPTTEIEAGSQHKKIREKMEKAGARKALIVNILKPEGPYHPVKNFDDIIEIPGLIQLERREIDQSALQFIHQILVGNDAALF